MTIGSYASDYNQGQILKGLVEGEIPINLAAATLAPGSVERSVAGELRDIAVPITRFGAAANGSGDDVQAFVTGWANEAVLEVPARLICRVASDVIVPAGCSLIVRGQISGSPSFIAAGDAVFLGPGKIVCAYRAGSQGALVAGGGRFVARGLRIEGTVSDRWYGIGVSPGGDGIDDLLIEGCEFNYVSYGVLRHSAAVANAVARWSIINNRGYYCTGDFVEWNRGDNDGEGLISGNRFSYVRSTIANAGFGIGIAGGWTAGQINDFSQACKRIKITDNHIYDVAEGIHVEYTQDFEITGNRIQKTRATSGGAGNAGAGVAVYGCRDFSVSDNNVRDCDAGRGIYIKPGAVNGAEYDMMCHDYSCSRNELIDADINCSSGFRTTDDPPTTIIKNNNVIRGRLIYIGASSLYLQGNTIRGAKTLSASKALDVDYNASTYGSRWQPGRKLVAWITDNVATDWIGVSSATFANVLDPTYANNVLVHALRNNFGVAVSTDQSTWGGGPIYFTDNSNVPIGIELPLDALVFDTVVGTRKRVATAGCIIRSGTAYQIVDAATGVIKITSHTMTNRDNIYIGARITLTDSVPTAVPAIVGRVYIASAEYRMDLLDPATMEPINLGSLGNGSVTATTPATFTGDLYGSTTWDPGNVTAAAPASTTVNVTGAAVGDHAEAAFSQNLSGLQIDASVNSPGVVTARLYQPDSDAAGVDLGSGTLKVWVRK